MSRGGSVSICLAVFAWAASSADSPAPVPAIQADMAFLADDALEGHAPGTAGHEIAARYVTARFAALGLQPAGDTRTWYQNIRLLEQTLDADSALTLHGARGTRSWTQATHVIITANPQASVRSIDAPVVFVGFGLDAPELGFDDYRGLDVRGKIVAALIGVPAGTPSEMGSHLNASKDRVASQRGAVGMILLDTRVVRSLYPWSQRLANDASPRMTRIEQDGRAFMWSERLPTLRSGRAGIGAASSATPSRPMHRRRLSRAKNSV